MKKIISSALVVVMMLTVMLSSFTVSAAGTTISFGKQTAKDVCEFFADNMLKVGTPHAPDSYEAGQRRVEISNLLIPYLETDTGINNLVKMLNGEVTMPADLQRVFDSTENLDANKDSLIFLLKLLVCTTPEARVSAFASFKADEEVSLTESTKASLERIYEMFVPEAARTILAVNKDTVNSNTATAHNITAASLLNLAKPFAGCFMFTDDASNSANLALKENSVSAAFAQKATENLTGYTVNAADASNAEALLEMMAASVNREFTESEIYDIKLVLKAVGLYEEPTSNRRGGGGGGAANVAKPTAKPTAEPSAEPTVAPTIIPEPQVIPTPEPADSEHVSADIENHWGKNYIASLAKRKIFRGYEDGSYGPDLGITREEVAVLIIRVLDSEHLLGTAEHVNFSDKEHISDWALDSVNLAVLKKIFTGYDNNEFGPKQVITREQMVTILMRTIEDKVLLEKLDYKDTDSISDWSREHVNMATALGIVSGDADGSFRPQDPITRAEAAKMIYNFMYVLGMLDETEVGLGVDDAATADKTAAETEENADEETVEETTEVADNDVEEQVEEEAVEETAEADIEPEE